MNTDSNIDIVSPLFTRVPACTDMSQAMKALRFIDCHHHLWDQTPVGILSWRQGLQQLAELPYLMDT